MMSGVRRWAGLRVVSVVAAVCAALVVTASSPASAAPARPAAPAASVTPVQMNYACTSKVTGGMRYVSSPTECTADENAVTIVPGPVYLCVYLQLDFVVRQVAATADCPSSIFRKEVTLPPTSGPVYFCALKTNGMLSYTTSPSRCNSLQFPVVVPVPAPTLANIESSTLQYYAGTPPVRITASLTVSSPVTTTLVGATVDITSGLVSGNDSLGFTSQNGITGSYDASTGLLTLTGTASVADYQAALRSVTYRDSNALTAPGSRTVSFQVNDGRASGNLSNVVTRTIAVATNTAPACKNLAASTDKHTAIAIKVLPGCSDVDGDTLAVTSVNTAGTKGLVSINPDGTIEYNPNGQFQGLTQGQTATDSFTFQVFDGYQDSSPATVTVTINGVNDKPVISNVETTPLSYEATAPPVVITSTLTLSDDDDSTMSSATVAITSGLASGADTLSFANANGITGSYDASTGVLTLTGAASVADYQAALRSVEFSTTDTAASPAPRVVSFTVTDSVGATSNAATRTIDVSVVPQPPTAVNHSYNAVGNTTLAVGTTPTGPAATVSGSLLDGDSGDALCGTLSVTANTAPGHGTASVNPDGTFSYLPNAGYTGTDTFQYTITCSSSKKTATASVTITVGTLVWYVDDSRSAAGTGESDSPFNTLAAAASAAGANGIIFLYQGSAAYTGGLAMKPGQHLWGQPHGLTVGGYHLVAPGGSDPTITNSGGNGIDLASGADVEDVEVSGASATGINGSGVTGSVTIANCTITGSTVDNAVITDTSGTLDLTVTGSTFSNDTSSANNDYGLDINANGSTNATVSVTGSTFTGNLGNEFYFTTDSAAAGTNSVTFSDNTVSGGGGVLFNPGGTSKTAITVHGNNVQKSNANGIGIDDGAVPSTSATVTGTISGNTIGTPTVAGAGNDIGIYAEGSGTETLAITDNQTYQYDNLAGIYFIDREGSPTMNLTITGNTIADPGQFGSWGLYGTAGAQTGDAGQVCAAISGNSMTGSAQPGQGGADFELDQNFATTIRLPGYTGGSLDSGAVVTFIQGNNNSGGAPSGIASVSGSGGGFTGGASCPMPS